ncbi:hypothetical protein WUBG_11425, partial [Wuchereria bancrofti]
MTLANFYVLYLFPFQCVSRVHVAWEMNNSSFCKIFHEKIEGPCSPTSGVTLQDKIGFLFAPQYALYCCPS